MHTSNELSKFLGACGVFAIGVLFRRCCSSLVRGIPPLLSNLSQQPSAPILKFDVCDLIVCLIYAVTQIMLHVMRVSIVWHPEI
jgi:hypothetical protein